MELFFCREGGGGFDYRLAMAVPDMWIKLLKVGFGFFFVFVVIRLVSYCRGCIFGLRITLRNPNKNRKYFQQPRLV